jgi:hypothetical protein
MKVEIGKKVGSWKEEGRRKKAKAEMITPDRRLLTTDC